ARRGAVERRPGLEGVLAGVERGGADAGVGGEPADVRVVDARLSQDVEERMAARVQPLEAGVGRSVAAFVDDGRYELFADQVEDGRAEGSAGRADDAMGRPGVDEVGMVGEVPGGGLVVVAGGD